MLLLRASLSYPPQECYGPDSMILSLALAQHSRLVHGALEAQGGTEFGVGEALLKQHVAALELVGTRGGRGEECFGGKKGAQRREQSAVCTRACWSWWDGEWVSWGHAKGRTGTTSPNQRLYLLTITGAELLAAHIRRNTRARHRITQPLTPRLRPQTQPTPVSNYSMATGTVFCRPRLPPCRHALSQVGGSDSEDAAVARYKLGTWYYAHDMLQDAGAAVRQAATAMRAHYPEEHDMVGAEAGGERRAARGKSGTRQGTACTEACP